MSENISDVLDIVNNQNQLRGKEAINLIASENVQSDAVKQIESNDFMGRYAEGHPNTAQQDNRYFEGTRYIDQIESMTTRGIIQLQNVCRLMFPRSVEMLLIPLWLLVFCVVVILCL